MAGNGTKKVSFIARSNFRDDGCRHDVLSASAVGKVL